MWENPLSSGMFYGQSQKEPKSLPDDGSEQVEPSTRYPPTTAEWVTSPLMRQQALEQNPLEAAPRSSIKASARLGALLAITGGVLGLIGIFIPWATVNVGAGASAVTEYDVIKRFYLWYLLLALLSIFASTIAVARGISLLRKTSFRYTNDVIVLGLAGFGTQIANGVTIVVSAAMQPGQVGYTLETGYGILLFSFLLVLAGGFVTKFIARPAITMQELSDEMKYRRFQRGVRRRIRGWR
jgi:hypothetical protein